MGLVRFAGATSARLDLVQQAQNWVGRRIPLHATSSGKVLLTGQDDELPASLVPTLPAYTESTVTRRAALRADLAEGGSRPPARSALPTSATY